MEIENLTEIELNKIEAYKVYLENLLDQKRKSGIQLKDLISGNKIVNQINPIQSEEDLARKHILESYFRKIKDRDMTHALQYINYLYTDFHLKCSDVILQGLDKIEKEINQLSEKIESRKVNGN